MVGANRKGLRSGSGVALVLVTMLLAIGSSPATASAKQGEGGVSATVPPSAGDLPAGRQVFPVKGAHEYWDGMGAGRGHQGVDVGAACGTPLVAVQASRVRYSKYHSAAGNYVVLDVKGSQLDFVYMHMEEPASVEAGQTLVAGQLVGTVGETGRASGCHLHFEVWDGPYYGGGSVIDPMPFLTVWDPAAKKKRAHRHR